MRTVAILALFIFLPTIAMSQGLMRFYRMTYGISGFYQTGSSNTDIDFTTGTAGTEVKRDVVRIASRNGFFLSRNFVMGVEFNWEQTTGDSRPVPNLIGYRSESFERRLFLGPLIRLYQPMSMRWFLYPEISFGYSQYLSETEESSIEVNNLPQTVTARGFAFHAGAGFGYLLTRNIVFDISARYMRAWRFGEYDVPGSLDVNVNMKEYDVQLLVGFQLHM
jgi:opacity protein-like surface antigen